MTKETVIQRYETLGLITEEGSDKPGTLYAPHKHEKTYLWTVDGSIMIKKGVGNWKTYTAGQECVIEDGEIHEAKVGPDGWKYIAAYDEEEAKKYDEGQ